MTDSVFDAILGTLPADSARPLIEIPGGPTYSYADMKAATARYARFLAELGLVPGDRVAAQVEKSPEALFLYLACMRAGLVYLPLNPAYTGSEVDYLLGDAKPRLVLCGGTRRDEVRPIAEGHGVEAVLTLEADGGGSFTDGAAGKPADFPPVPRAAHDLAALLYTSGTTGRPKGAMLSHGNLVSNGLTLRDAWGFTGSDVLLHALPLFHTHGLFVACHCVLLSGARMIWLPGFDRAALIAELPRASVLMGVPTFYIRLLAGDDFDASRCREVRLFISGSAPLLAETHEAFARRTGHVILERYGMTEIGMATSNPLAGERRAGTVGLPLPGTGLRVVGEGGAALGPGEVGGIEVRGPNVFAGYWRMPGKTAEEFTTDGWFRTGDMGLIDADGYVHLVGRTRDLVISGGFNVYPKEVEEVIDALDGIGETAVIGVPHPDFGEAVVAVATREGTEETPSEETPSEDDVIARAKRRLANYKVPKRVFFVDALPRNAMGKVQKKDLRDRFGATFTG